MIMRIPVFVVAAAILLPSAASAADEFIKGVYLTSEELCAEAKADSLQSVIEAGNLILTARGIESIEYNCEFVTVAKATRSPAWLVNAVCQEPGYLFPDVLTITEMSPTQIELVSVTPVDPEIGGGNGGSYVLCEGVAPP
jgi:hypothetical protein